MKAAPSSVAHCRFREGEAHVGEEQPTGVPRSPIARTEHRRCNASVAERPCRRRFFDAALFRPARHCDVQGSLVSVCGAQGCAIRRSGTSLRRASPARFRPRLREAACFAHTASVSPSPFSPPEGCAASVTLSFKGMRRSEVHLIDELTGDSRVDRACPTCGGTLDVRVTGGSVFTACTGCRSLGRGRLVRASRGFGLSLHTAKA